MQMVKRRQEVRGKYRGATVIDDFAHHPRAVQETIRAINLLYPTSKVCVVIEPNSATARSSIFQKEFGECFKGASEVIWARPEKSTTVADQQNLDCIELSHRLKKGGISSVAVSNLVDLREQIDLHTGEKNVLLILSNGTCLGLWESDFVREIH
jgi:UDP-N-acetylmuramate: L-alanyl-gamma-D-glutamyl-meso-diaminopimelate ligase